MLALLAVRRGALCALLTAVLLGVPVGPAAQAHTVRGAVASDFRSVLGGLQPPVVGVTVQLREFGGLLTVTDAAAVRIIIVGYDGEPFLRLDHTGAFVNDASPSRALSTDFGAAVPTAVPPRGPAPTAVRWRQVSQDAVVSWHDHRTHLSAQESVTGIPHPRAAGPARLWAVPVLLPGATGAITGRIDYAPPSSGLPWWTATVLLLAGAAVTLAPGPSPARRFRRRAPAGASVRGDGRRRRTALLMVALVALDVTHSVGLADTAATPARRLGVFLRTNAVQIPVWLVGVAAAVACWRYGRRGWLALTALTVGVVGGGGDLAVFSRPFAPFAGGLTADRLLTAGTLGIGLGVAVGAYRWLAASPPAVGLPHPAPDSEVGGLPRRDRVRGGPAAAG